MVGVQVREEDLVQVVVGDHERREVGGRSRADVEEELVAVAQLHQEARGGLTVPGRRHAGSAGDDPNLVRLQFLRARVVRVAVLHGAHG